MAKDDENALLPDERTPRRVARGVWVVRDHMTSDPLAPYATKAEAQAAVFENPAFSASGMPTIEFIGWGQKF